MPGHNIDVNINFGNANQNFQTLIDSMNKLQGIVTQLGNTIQTTNNNTSTSNSKAQKSITDYAGSYKTLTEDIRKNRAELAKQIAALEELRRISSVTGKTYTKETNDQIDSIKKLEATIKQQTTTLKQYNSALGQTSVQAKTTNNSLNSLIKGFNSLGAVLGVSFGAYGAFRGLQYGIKVISDFDLANAKLRSILALTKKEMEDISQSAIRIGQNSIFGAKGVTELQIELAKMGFAKQEIIDMQESIVNLATATQEELAPSAEVVANILRSFQLPAAEAARIVDIMGKAFNDSALDLANFREAIKYVAPIAAQANFKFEETVSLLEQLSNAGIKGSLAGTGLTNIISRLGNENSKFVKTLGRTVNGFDDFLEALIELKSKGADLSDTFELVDRRAAATFTILLQGVTSVEQFKRKLEESAGVMKDQTAVQLDTITNKIKLLQNSFDSLILSVDKGDGQVSNFLKNTTGWLSTIINQLTSAKDIALNTDWKQVATQLDQLGAKPNKNFLEIEQEAEKAGKLQSKAFWAGFVSFDWAAELAKESDEIYEKQRKKLVETNKAITAVILDQAKAQINVWREQFGSAFIGTAVPDVILPALQKQIETLDPTTVRAKRLSTVIELLNKEYTNYAKSLELSTEEAKNLENAEKTRLAALKAQLELQKQIAINNIKITESAEDDRRAIIEETYLWDKKIAELTIQNAEEKNLRLKIIEQDYVLAIRQLDLDNYKDFLEIKKKEQEVLTEFYKQWNDIVESSYKEQAELDEQLSKQIEDNLNKWFETYEKNYAKLKDLQKKNPLLGLFVDFSMQDLAEMTPEDIDKLSNSFDVWDDSLKSIEDSLKSFADTWVESFDRIVDARNNMVDEAQQALETELQLAEAGFASNVSLKRKELEEAKKLREQALEDQKKAQKLQLAIDSAAQASSLAVTIANYFQATSKIPVVGVALALAAIGTMLGTFAKFKALAKEQAAVKYEKGGWIGGRLHSQGGTPIEAEKGEFVINRKAAAKHKLMIEAINNDDNVAINRMYINGLKQTALKASVSLDDSEDLKAIRKALERNNKEVTYFGNYRIEKAGNITTKIRVN